MDIKKRYAITETLLGLSRGSLILGLAFGVLATLVASTVPKVKENVGGRRYHL